MADRRLQHKQLQPINWIYEQDSQGTRSLDPGHLLCDRKHCCHGVAHMMRRTARVRAEGQSLVEFALVLPLFLLLILGVVDGGRAIFAYNQMAQVTRAVAREASTTCFQTTPACSSASGPIAASITRQQAGFQGPVTWTVRCINPATGAVPTNAGSDFCKVGYLVRVSVASAFTLITPVASSFGPVNVGATTDQEILQ